MEEQKCSWKKSKAKMQPQKCKIEMRNQNAKHENANTKMQIHKYTNTSYDEVTERPNRWYIFEKGIVQGYQK